MVDTQGPVAEAEEKRAYQPSLRLIWSNPDPAPRPRARVDFALAIERQLSGADGLSHEQFLALYSGRRSRLALAPS
jgi:hypothetical protein